MKNVTLCIIGFLLGSLSIAQEKVNPIIKNFGGIYDIPEATVKADPELAYKLVVDINKGAMSKTDITPGFVSAARLLNLHAISGVISKNMEVALAIHGSATTSLVNNDAYNKRYGMDNPNVQIIKELKEVGVRLIVCGQSMKFREVNATELLPEIEIGTSTLTTITTFQLKGYALVKF
jgi:intracellular sulfur oxidation DsrE/DsrF family protein